MIEGVKTPFKSDPSCWFASPDCEVSSHEVATLNAFTLSENAQSPWVVSKSLHNQPLPTSSVLTLVVLLSDSVLSLYWTTLSSWLRWVFIDLYAIACAVSSVTDPLFAFICWAMLTDLLKSWFLMWFYTEFPVMGQVLLLQAAVTTIACFDYHWTIFVYWSSFHHEMGVLWVMYTITLISSELSFSFIIDFNRKQKGFNRNLIDISMCPLVLLVAPWRKLFLREILPKLVRIF